MVDFACMFLISCRAGYVVWNYKFGRVFTIGFCFLLFRCRAHEISHLLTERCRLMNIAAPSFGKDIWGKPAQFCVIILDGSLEATPIDSK